MTKANRYRFVDGRTHFYLNGPIGPRRRDVIYVGGTIKDCMVDTLGARIKKLSSVCDKVVLVVDQPDFLLAANDSGVTVALLRSAMKDLRKVRGGPARRGESIANV